jgi:DNA primase
MFYCFGCNVGGDAIKFIQLIENITYPEAIRLLAERSGIPIPRSEAEEESYKKKTRLMKVMETARRFFSESLFNNPGAMEYLRNRTIRESTISTFSIGFAPGNNSLMRHLHSEGYTNRELLDCGLVIESETGDHYDRFRNRIIFPIFDLSGRTIAFGGRIIGEGQPKYLNSPETQLYHKGSNLYGLQLGRNAIRERDFAILVEGYFDCVVPYQAGVNNIVASLGTALTENQVKILGRYTRNVIVSFDPDSAGTSAAIRSIDLFLANGFQVNILRLPEGEDPDSFILKEGTPAYLEKLKESEPYLDFLLNLFLSQERNPQSPKAKSSVAGKLLPYLAKIPNRIQRSEYISRISSRLKISPEAFSFELRKHRKPVRENSIQVNFEDEISLAERSLLAALLETENPQDLASRLDMKYFEGLKTEALFLKILELRNQNSEISVINLREALNEKDLWIFDRIVVGGEGKNFLEKNIESCISALKDQYLDRLSLRIQEEIEKEEKDGVNSSRLNELLREKEKIRRRKQASSTSLDLE